MGDERVGSPGWCEREPLTGTDLTDFLALWRVCGCRDSPVEQVAGEHYVEQGRPVLPFLADGLTALIEVGHVKLGEPGPAAPGIRPLVVTASGRARYEDLCDRQGVAPYPVMAKTANVGDGTPCHQAQRVQGDSDGSQQCG